MVAAITCFLIILQQGEIPLVENFALTTVSNRIIEIDAKMILALIIGIIIVVGLIKLRLHSQRPQMIM